MAQHAYDAPNLSPTEFQRAVMNDPTVALPLRLQAAEDLQGIPRVTLFDLVPAHQWATLVGDMAYISWCSDHGMLDPASPSAHALYAKSQTQ
jgi:hypothetical protein